MNTTNRIGRHATEQERRDLAARPVPAGLCVACDNLRLLASKTSVFVRCALAEEDPRFPRYPPLPVSACGGFRPAA